MFARKEDNLVYTVEEIQKNMKISRTKSYELVNSAVFPVIKIGKAIRIPAKPFHEWLEKEMPAVSALKEHQKG